MEISQQEKIYQIALKNIKGIGSVIFKKLLDYFGSAENVFENPKVARRFSNLNEAIVTNLMSKSTVSEAEKIFITHVKNNINVVCYSEKSYPFRLKKIIDCPPILYCSNTINFNVSKVISIVGTRNMTTYGKERLNILIHHLSSYNVLIVSGLAYGVDICAHQLAMKNGLPTVAVLAGGLDSIYYDHHAKIAIEMMKKGGLTSEQAFGVQAEKYHFPLRNRIIAGLSDVSIVVEAGKNSGSLITANYANEYNREVFSIPGCVGKTYSEGCNNLIKKHKAHLLTSVDDIASLMNWDRLNKIERINSDRNSRNLKLTKEEERVVKVLAGIHGSVTIDILHQLTAIDIAKLSSAILALELKKLLEITAGNKYRLTSA